MFHFKNFKLELNISTSPLYILRRFNITNTVSQFTTSYYNSIQFHTVIIIVSVWVRRGGCIGSWWGNRRERDHWGGLGVDGWIILGRISRRWDMGIWTGLAWPRIETVGGRF